jgi:hypothetical protein
MRAAACGLVPIYITKKFVNATIVKKFLQGPMMLEFIYQVPVQLTSLSQARPREKVIAATCKHSSESLGGG